MDTSQGASTSIPTAPIENIGAAPAYSSPDNMSSTVSDLSNNRSSSHTISDAQPAMTSSNTSYGFPGQYGQDAASFQTQQQQQQSRAQTSAQQMNIEDFSQFIPNPSSVYNQLPQGWETMSFPGLTPGAGGQDTEEFAKMLADVESWAGGEPLVQDGWNHI